MGDRRRRHRSRRRRAGRARRRRLPPLREEEEGGTGAAAARAMEPAIGAAPANPRGAPRSVSNSLLSILALSTDQFLNNFRTPQPIELNAEISKPEIIS